MPVLPALITETGDRASKRFLEYFTVNIRNKSTRAAYDRAAADFLHWCEGRGLTRSGACSRCMWPQALDRDDANHSRAKTAWVEWLRAGAALLSNNYVLLETAALLQHRIGVAAVRALHEEVTPLLQIDWVTEERRRAGMEAVLAASRKK